MLDQGWKQSNQAQKANNFYHRTKKRILYQQQAILKK